MLYIVPRLNVNDLLMFFQGIGNKDDRGVVSILRIDLFFL